MKTVKEVSRITGVSVRTLHHYDAIGLLKPTAVTEAGYRLYDDAALERMQSILLFRELQFPLKDIKRILDAPDFDPMAALAQQVHLLEMQREHLEQLISHAREIQQTGVFSMDFSKFDTSEIEKYTAEAKQKWGKTPAWQEFEKKNVTPRQAQKNANDLIHFCPFRRHPGHLSRFQGRTGAGRRAARLHREPLLHLHQGNFAKSGADVHCR